MASTDDKPALKITLEDLARVNVRQGPEGAVAVPAGAPSTRQYGNISAAASEAPVVDEGKAKFYLQGWFYLGVAGLAGAVLGWAICEPGFVDAPGAHWGNLVMIPLVLMFLCLGVGIAESIVERSVKKALQRTALILPLALVFSIVFEIAGGLIYGIGRSICASLGVQSVYNPAVWVARGLGWMVFGGAAGLVYGLVDRSVRKGRYGALGAVIGAGVGGMVFDPISFAAHTASLSRAVGFGLFGMATGVAMGIVESALKDRWLYVASGPLAGKQFILYKPVTVIGSSQQCDIYLFKDTSIQPQHASIELRGAQTFLRAQGPVFVSGQPARNRALVNGDLVQIGRYAFHFRERHR